MHTDKHYLWHLAGALEWKASNWNKYKGSGPYRVRMGRGYGYENGAGSSYEYHDGEGGYSFDINYWERDDY